MYENIKQKLALYGITYEDYLNDGAQWGQFIIPSSLYSYNPSLLPNTNVEKEQAFLLITIKVLDAVDAYCNFIPSSLEQESYELWENLIGKRIANLFKKAIYAEVLERTSSNSFYSTSNAGVVSTNTVNSTGNQTSYLLSADLLGIQTKTYLDNIDWEKISTPTCNYQDIYAFITLSNVIMSDEYKNKALGVDANGKLISMNSSDERLSEIKVQSELNNEYIFTTLDTLVNSTTRWLVDNLAFDKALNELSTHCQEYTDNLVDGVDTRLQALDDREAQHFTTLTQKDTEQDTSITNLDTRVQTNTEAIGNINTVNEQQTQQINKNTTDIENLSVHVDGIDIDVGDLKNKVDNNTTNITTNTNDIKQLKTDVSTANNKISTLENNVSKNTSDIVDVNHRIDNLPTGGTINPLNLKPILKIADNNLYVWIPSEISEWQKEHPNDGLEIVMCRSTTKKWCPIAPAGQRSSYKKLKSYNILRDLSPLAKEIHPDYPTKYHSPNAMIHSLITADHLGTWKFLASVDDLNNCFLDDTISRAQFKKTKLFRSAVINFHYFIDINKTMFNSNFSNDVNYHYDKTNLSWSYTPLRLKKERSSEDLEWKVSLPTLKENIKVKDFIKFADTNLVPWSFVAQTNYLLSNPAGITWHFEKDQSNFNTNFNIEYQMINFNYNSGGAVIKATVTANVMGTNPTTYNTVSVDFKDVLITNAQNFANRIGKALNPNLSIVDQPRLESPIISQWYGKLSGGTVWNHEGFIGSSNWIEGSMQLRWDRNLNNNDSIYGFTMVQQLYYRVNFTRTNPLPTAMSEINGPSTIEIKKTTNALTQDYQYSVVLSPSSTLQWVKFTTPKSVPGVTLNPNGILYVNPNDVTAGNYNIEITATAVRKASLHKTKMVTITVS